MSNSTKEAEFKFRADGVKLSDFQKLMEEIGYNSNMSVSSWDTYYLNGDGNFLRYRESPNSPELTVKRKTTDSNNWERVELDLPLDKSKISSETVDKFAELLGYQKNFKIWKNCFIFWLDNVNFVYYQVSDENMNELGRFIEVELNKEKVEDLGEDYLDELKRQEAKLSELGISPQNRLKKSLFEMFVRE